MAKNRGGSVIRKKAPINLIVHVPETEAGKEELAKRVSEVHAEAVIRRLNGLNCPAGQKLALLDAIIEAVKKENREQT